MQSVNGAQLLNITFLLVLSASTSAATVLLTDIFPLATIYESLKSHKLDLSIDVLKLICLLAEYVRLDSLFISTQFFVLNLDGWFDAWSNKFSIFDIPILLY